MKEKEIQILLETNKLKEILINLLKRLYIHIDKFGNFLYEKINFGKWIN